MAMNKGERKPFHVTVAERIIAQLKEGTAPWQKPWEADGHSPLPMNPVSGKRYRGINAINLSAHGYNDNRWLTYKQAASMGAQVRKGEKGAAVQYWQYEEERAVRDDSGRPLKDEGGNTITQRVELERPRAFYAVVFNAEQIDGLPPQQPRPKPSWEPTERAERILANSGVHIVERAGDRAYYHPASDTITLPLREQFQSADRFYATALHELGHSTGHPSRLARDLSHPFGSVGYAKEELRAEISSLLLGDELRIGHDPAQHAAYVASWVSILENDPLEIVRACADAEKILTHVLALEQKRALALDAAASVEIQADDPAFQDEFDEPVARLFEDETLNFNGFEFYSGAGEVTLEAALGAHGMHTLGDIVGREPSYEAMFNAAVENLSPLFGIAAASVGDDHEWPAYLERKGLASAAAQHVENAIEKIKIEQRSSKVQAERTYLNVPYAERREAKAAGARWDAIERSWYAPGGSDMDSLNKWLKEAEAPVSRELGEDSQAQDAARPAATHVAADNQPKPERIILAVPYTDKEAAKAAGARWDRGAKCWYAIEGQVDAKAVERWIIDPAKARQDTAKSPYEEFADAMRSAGLTVPPGHPIMDGSKQRVPTVDDKGKERSGFYFAFANDAVPGGYIMNNRTQQEIRWRAHGVVLSPEERALALAKMEQDRIARAKEQSATFEQTALRVQEQIKRYTKLSVATEYHLSKGISVTDGAYTDKNGLSIVLPAIDTSGKHWTTQYIQPNGEKVFAKNSVKEGHFHVVNGGVGSAALAALDKAPVIIIGEGYATAATISEVVGYATVAGFDSGNLPAVAEALRARYPDKPFLLAADDDQRVVEKYGHNPGVDKATKAAELSRGAVIVPVFAPNEQAGDKKAFTDFNDLANKSSLGREGVRRQLEVGIERATKMQAAWTNERQRQQEQRYGRNADYEDVETKSVAMRR